MGVTVSYNTLLSELYKNVNYCSSSLPFQNKYGTF